MSMHLEGPHLTTTRYNAKKRKPSVKQQRAQAEHDRWLMSRGLHPSQRKQTGKKPAKLKMDKFQSEVAHIPSSGDMRGDTAKKAQKVYTGTEIIGIAQMHKSNAVPVRNKKSAEEVAKMRRN